MKKKIEIKSKIPQNFSEIGEQHFTVRSVVRAYDFVGVCSVIFLIIVHVFNLSLFVVICVVLVSLLLFDNRASNVERETEQTMNQCM